MPVRHLSKGAGEPDPHAIAAARAVDGKLAVPEFGSPRSQGQTDFNDLHRALGLDAVRVCIAAGLAECLRCACANPDHPRTFDRIAAGKWTAIYDTLTEDRPSVLGAVTSRAEALVLRMALLYSLLDPHASLIGIQHLKAAVAVWQFCDESARYIFGQAETDPDANRIVEVLQERGEMTSTEINDLFHGHGEHHPHAPQPTERL